MPATIHQPGTSSQRLHPVSALQSSKYPHLDLQTLVADTDITYLQIYRFTTWTPSNEPVWRLLVLITAVEDMRAESRQAGAGDRGNAWYRPLPHTISSPAPGHWTPDLHHTGNTANCYTQPNSQPSLTNWLNIVSTVHMKLYVACCAVLGV